MGAADPRRHAFEGGAVMTAIADARLTQMAHLVRAQNQNCFRRNPWRIFAAPQRPF